MTDPFFFRFRSIRARSSRLGVAIPLLLTNSVRNASYLCPLSRRTIDRIAALASSVVASIPTSLPLSNPRWASNPKTHPNTFRCVSKSINRRVREMVE